MQIQSNVRAVVCEGAHKAPYSLSPQLVKPPGSGACTCCRLGHVVVDADGNERTVPCDKQVIGKVVEDMLVVRIAHEQQHDLTAWRVWMAMRRFWLQCLPCCPDAPPRVSTKARLDAFLYENAFLSAVDISKDGTGVSPLICAAAAGDVEVVRALLDAGADARAPFRGKPIGNLALVSRTTALHYGCCMTTFVDHGAQCVELLLRHNASLDARAGPFGLTPLHMAAGTNANAVSALARGCAAAGVPLNVDAGVIITNASALGVAAYMGTPGSVATLLELRADASYFTNHGDHVWADACSNPQMDVATLELIKRHAGAPNINTRFQPRTLKWAAFESLCELLEHAGRGKRGVVRSVANKRGSTPLHWAARRGRLDLVRWLLENGAEPSVAVRNARGRTPQQMAHLFGPHLAVEAELKGRLRTGPAPPVAEKADDLWVTSAFDVIALTEVPTHAALKTSGKLVRYNQRTMDPLIYIAIEPMSDDARESVLAEGQLRTLQRELVRMHMGEMPSLSAPCIDVAAHRRSATMDPSEWQAMVKDAVVWFAHISVPPLPDVLDGTAGPVALPGRNKLHVAHEGGCIVRACFAARCMLVVCPSVPHTHEPLRKCDSMSWWQTPRGQLELLLPLLRSARRKPLVVALCSGDNAPRAVPLHPVRPSLCKGYLQLVHEQMRAQAVRDEQHGRRGSCQLWRAVSSATSPDVVDALQTDTSNDAQLAAFMETGGFGETSKGKRKGVTPLMSAAMAGNVGLMRALLDAGEDANGRYQGVAVGNLGLVRGATALHHASAVSSNAACVELLLRHNAILDARAGPFGLTPLHAAAAANEHAVRALARGCAAAGVPLNIYAGTLLNNAPALSIAAYMGTPGSVAALLKLEADASHFTDHGAHVWCDACSNAHMEVATLELIKRHANAPNINTRFQPRTLKWSTIDRFCELLERAGRGKKGDLLHELANTRGSTPLHWAAAVGRIDLVRWLLDNGAEPSVAVRNARGRTPLQMAHFFGPHLAVEAELVRNRPRPAKRTSPARMISRFTRRTTSTSHSQLLQNTPTQLFQTSARLTGSFLFRRSTARGSTLSRSSSARGSKLFLPPPMQAT
jgi:ankyrin repeat protein